MAQKAACGATALDILSRGNELMTSQCVLLLKVPVLVIDD